MKTAIKVEEKKRSNRIAAVIRTFSDGSKTLEIRYANRACPGIIEGIGYVKEIKIMNISRLVNFLMLNLQRYDKFVNLTDLFSQLKLV